MKLQFTHTAPFRVALTLLLTVAAVMSHSVLYTLLPVLLALPVWWRFLNRHKWLAILCGALLLAGIAWSLPSRGFDSRRRVNLLVAAGDTITSPSVGTWLAGALLPERELTRDFSLCASRTRDTLLSGAALQCLGLGQPVYVRQPSKLRPDMDYHLVIMPQGSRGCTLTDQQGREWLDSCIVVTLGATGRHTAYTSSDIQTLTRRVLPTLLTLGYAIDPRYVSVVDDSADGSLSTAASQAPGKTFRNIIRLGCPAAATPLPGSQARQVMVGTRPEYAKAYATWRDAGLNADHFAENSDSTSHAMAVDVLTGRMGVPMSRIEQARKKAQRLGYESRFVMFTDYSIPSGKYRFFLYDYKLQRFVVRSKCAHGFGLGSTEAVPVFSNAVGSQCTSLGDYAAYNVHPMAKNGRTAITLDGLDPTNDNANIRGIIMHSGMRMEGEIYPQYLKLGKISEGCVALSNIPFALVCGIVKSCNRPILLQCYH
ncbi:MAG: murein L,D-transpeptidase catalytic domain family protein [Muribaculaceae bacterium]|nr:murein L,D-transpeptidase catalytic domain family protein [Muribaculaceae bacterium]